MWDQRPSSRLLASDDWLLAQQMRAECEAEAWRRVRAELAAAPAIPEPANAPAPLHVGGSILLKALVRVLIGALGGWIAYIAVLDSGGGEFEAWLAAPMAFVACLALTAFEPLRGLVAMSAHAMRWALVIAACMGAIWLAVQMAA